MINKNGEKIKKIGSEKKYNHAKGNILVGTVDRYNTTSIYVNLGTWLTPTNTFEEALGAIRRRLIAKSNNISNIYFDGLKRSTFVLDYATTKEKRNGATYFSIEFTIYGKFAWNKDLHFAGECFADSMFELLNGFKEFSLSKTKKGTI